jgi:hypothetical protein
VTKIQLIRQGVSFYCEWGVIGGEYMFDLPG